MLNFWILSYFVCNVWSDPNVKLMQDLCIWVCHSMALYIHQWFWALGLGCQWSRDNQWWVHKKHYCLECKGWNKKIRALCSSWESLSNCLLWNMLFLLMNSMVRKRWENSREKEGVSEGKEKINSEKPPPICQTLMVQFRSLFKSTATVLHFLN